VRARRDPWSVRAAIALFGTLARLLPYDARARWGDEQAACFTELARAAHERRGVLSVAAVLLQSTGDLALRLPREHVRNGAAGTAVSELRYAVRSLLRAPGFTAASVLTLGLGLAAALSVFTLVYGVLLKPLPYGEPDRLVELDHRATRLDLDGGLGMTYGFFRFYAERMSTVEDLALYSTTTLTLTGPDQAVRITGARTTPSLVPLLRVMPARGRWFTADEGRAEGEPPIVLSHRIWRDAFGADPDVVDRTVELEGAPHRVVGVMPDHFAFPDRAVDIWMPLQPPTTGIGGWNFRSVARLAQGAQLESVTREMHDLLPRLVEADGTGQARDYVENAGVVPNVVSLHERVTGQVRGTLLVLLGTVGFVLLVALANVGNLFLVRAEEGRQRTALRRALGASAGHLAAGHLLEALLLTGTAGLVGSALAWLMVDAVRSGAPVPIPRLYEVGLDPSLALAAVGLCALIGLALGSIPALRGSGEAMLPFRDDDGRSTAGGRRLRGRNVLVAAQVALALVLLVGSGLLLRTFSELRSVDPGFHERQALTFRVGLPAARYDGRAAALAFHQELEDRIAALPGVRRVGAVATCLPLSGNLCWGEVLQIEGHPAEPGASPIVTGTRAVTPGYFETMGIAVRGRAIEERDLVDGDAVAVLSETAAARHFPGEDPIGRRVSLGGSERQEVLGDSGLSWYTVVGVADDVRARIEDTSFTTLIYLPARPAGTDGPPPHTMAYVVATSIPPASLAPAVREAVRALDPGVPVADVVTVREHITRAMAPTTFSFAVIGLAALIALLLGAVGVYAVTSYVVSRRTAEIGIRMALGAGRREVRTMVLRQGGGAVAVGVIIGLAGALGLSRFLAGMLHGVPPTDPVTYAAITGVLAVVAAAALWWPARRASRVDPVEAIRER
jgi:putative ABC transport system permease protein